MELGFLDKLLILLIVGGIIYLLLGGLGAAITSNLADRAASQARVAQERTAQVQAVAQANIEHSADRRVELQSFLAFLVVTSPTRTAVGWLIPLILGAAIGIGFMALWEETHG